jgi:hypothetical protein
MLIFKIVLNHGGRLIDLVVLATFVACAAPLPLNFDGGHVLGELGSRYIVKQKSTDTLVIQSPLCKICIDELRTEVLLDFIRLWHAFLWTLMHPYEFP